MGAPKNVTQNKYEYFQKPKWDELTKLNEWNPQADPSINFEEGNQINDLERSFVAPTGSYMTPELREQMMRSGRERIGQNAGQARRTDQYDQNRMKLGQLSTAAGLAAPEFAQTESTQQQKGGFWRQMAGAAVQGAAAGLI